MNLWVYRNWSRHATCTGHIKSHLKKIKIHRTVWLQAFFSPRWANVTQWSNHLTQRAEILTQRSNLTPLRAKNTVHDLPVYRTRFRHKPGIKQVGFTPFSFLFRDQQVAVGSLPRTLRKKMIYMKNEVIDILAPHARIGKNCSHDRADKFMKISCLPRESSRK